MGIIFTFYVFYLLFIVFVNSLYSQTTDYTGTDSLFNRKKISFVSNTEGFAPDAKQSKSYIICANGTMDRARKFLFFNSYPKVEPGAEIIVPKKAVKQGMTTGETVAI
jgi:hypothetical protein